jgi:hypothetical protein
MRLTVKVHWNCHKTIVVHDRRSASAKFGRNRARDLSMCQARDNVLIVLDSGQADWHKGRSSFDAGIIVLSRGGNQRSNASATRDEKAVSLVDGNLRPDFPTPVDAFASPAAARHRP